MEWSVGIAEHGFKSSQEDIHGCGHPQNCAVRHGGETFHGSGVTLGASNRGSMK